ncbi:hypothetical protein BS47DRAFT_1336072 [Hydnum rufescens UP504]|uniref:TLC domain-containing protein n=1 Tax=Hydnum rufescens UP504 TaxID=1448309 RepID=A0A9P6BBH6_9AGAM|nr:hypothetical protein BS47DRAFT_1336072 [Hydnum rufescens UP504]
MALSAVGEQYLPARLRPFIFLSHPVERPSHLRSQSSSSILWSRYYRIGPDDLPLIIGWTVIMLVLRWIILRQLKKFAHYWLGQSDRSHPPLNDAPNVNESVIPNTTSATSPVTTNGHAISNGNGLTSRKPSNRDIASKVGKDGTALKAALKTREHTVTRFAEQGFSCIYYTLAWCYGLWIHTAIYDSVLDTKAFWLSHPHIPLPAPVKFYLVLVFTYYSTQAIILHIEEHRRDHLQMFTHHVLTVLLLAGAYVTYLTRVSCAMFFIVDWCDILLPLGKMLKYMNIPVLPDITFLIFTVSWFITRQILFFRLVWSVTFDMPVYLSLEWNPAIDHLVTRKGWILFAVALWSVQVLLTIWFYMACKVLYDVFRGKAAVVEDWRSDDEGEGAE